MRRRSVPLACSFVSFSNSCTSSLLNQQRCQWEKSGSGAPLCPACHTAAAAGHHGCAHACQAPICTACSEARLDQRYCLNCLSVTASPSRCSALPAGSAGLAPVAYRFEPELHAVAFAAARPFGQETSLRVITAHAMRAILLAKATVASRAGRRRKTPTIQFPVALFHCSAR